MRKKSWILSSKSFGLLWEVRKSVLVSVKSDSEAKLGVGWGLNKVITTG